MSGPDIFLSYNREDAGRAKHFAEGFAAAGLDVWWDVALRSGEAYDEVTENALRNAKAVVVLWSEKSVVSRWVRAEATLAERRKTLMPAMIEPCERPIMFELVQTADLSHWQGDADDRTWRDFVGHVREFVGKDAGPPAHGKPDEPLPRLDQLSIVVLPFDNMSGDAEQDYFADGITEDIITDLSQVSVLMVIARNTAFSFKGQHFDVADVARQLNVTHVLEGSVRKSGNRVRVTAQLIDGSTRGHVWAERFDRNLDDIFALQDELSQAIVGALKIKLLPNEKQAIVDRGTDSVEAYDLFLKAESAFHGSADAFERSIILARAAVELDPKFGRAWSSLATIYSNAAYLLPDAEEDYRALADEAFERAIALTTDPRRSRMIEAVQFSFRQDWLAAGEAFSEVARDTPGIDGSLEIQMAIFSGHVGRLNESIGQFRNGLRLDPMMSPLVFNVVLDGAGRREEADIEYRRQAKFGTHLPLIDFFDLLRIMARGDRDAAKRRLEAYTSHKASFLPMADEILANFDAPVRARAILREAAENPAFRDVTHLSSIAPVAAYFGDIELATECLRVAFVELRGIAMSVVWHPLLTEVRKTERFKQIVRDLGLYDYWRKSGHWADLARPLGDDDFEMIG